MPAKKTTAKCTLCKQEFNIEAELFEIPGENMPSAKTKKRYCAACLPQAKANRKEIEDHKALRDYVYDAYGGKDYWGKNGFTGIAIQLDKFKTDYKFTYKGMLLTLKYYYEDRGNPWPERPSVGIIPYVYEEATQAFIADRERKKRLDSIDVEAALEKKRYITLHHTTSSSEAYMMRKLPQLDIDDLGGDE